MDLDYQACGPFPSLCDTPIDPVVHSAKKALPNSQSLKSTGSTSILFFRSSVACFNPLFTQRAAAALCSLSQLLTHNRPL